MNYFLNSQKLVRHITESVYWYVPKHFPSQRHRPQPPIARLAGRLEDGDCLPRALTPGVVDLVAAATNYVQPGDGKK